MTATITALNYSNTFGWTLNNNNPPFAPQSQGPDSLIANFPQINFKTIWNRLYLSEISLAGGADTTLDLTSLTDFFGNSLTFAHIWLVMLNNVTNIWTIQAGASNGLDISGESAIIRFLPGMNQDVKCGIPTGAASGGLAVTGSAKTITITNTGGAADTARLAIHGSST